ncbi:Crp/Fnr family transcriptional regulator [Haloimpatiens lingqiaonensis]|uniref:Crp/Fnr family transcriptional regulator n=1 Tax=Haloimpatiens lingqiaonensis TaxID=1380675 RepID=UPI001FAABE42|nr:Crp/Fnr family transcriptional regulator [Haloimpatiens lingqiaonensis]
MDKHLGTLRSCYLFKEINEDEIGKLLHNVECMVNSYSKGEIIATEGELCSKIGIVIEGAVEAQKIYASGKIVTIDKLNIGNTFGEAIIFSNTNKYPATIMSSNSSKVLFIHKKDIINLCSMEKKILNNFMNILSNKILMLNRKIKNMSYKTLRQKIAGFIFDEYKKQGSNTINLPYSRKETAEHLGIPRPSLSRELIRMKEEGIIDFYKNSIKILNVVLLEDIFLE